MGFLMLTRRSNTVDRKHSMSDNQQPDYDDFTRQIIQQYTEIAQLAGALAHEIKNNLLLKFE